jgi:hypothetical protein
MRTTILFVTVPVDLDLEMTLFDALVSREECGTLVTYGIAHPERNGRLLETLGCFFPQDCWTVLFATTLCKIVCVAPRLKRECSFPREAGDYFFSGFNSLRTFLLLKTKTRTLSRIQQQWMKEHALLYHLETLEGKVVATPCRLPVRV